MRKTRNDLIRIATNNETSLRNSNSAELTSITLDCRSVANKTLAIADLALNNDADIMALTETWLGTGNDK